jgi:hypothetical protein
MITGRLQLLTSSQFVLQIAITQTVRLCSGGIKGCNFSCRRHEAEWNRALQIHTFLLSALDGAHRSGSLVSSSVSPVAFEKIEISCSQQEFNRISRPILVSDLMIWGQNGNTELFQTQHAQLDHRSDSDGDSRRPDFQLLLHLQ